MLKPSSIFAKQIPTTAYWAGFIAADGCVNKNGSLILCLSKKDEDRLYTLRDNIGSGNVKDIISTCQTGKFPSTKYSIFSKNIVHDLATKTTRLYPPSFKDKTCLLSYLKGYIDGDGCIRIDKNNGYRLILTSSSKKMLEWVKSIFDKLDNKFPRGLVAQVRKDRNWYSYEITGTRAYRLLKIIKSSTSYGLKRKWGKVI